MAKNLSDILSVFQRVQVYALVGESGTGKSFRSKLLAEEYGIHAIIDDGLLIQDEKIVAGRSAKREKTYMGAVRAALFDDKEHRDSVARVLRKTHIKKILLLGTSEKMVSKIAMRLQLPQPQKIIHIEDIASQEDIENLADWFWHYGENYWNGEYFGIDEIHVLIPIYEEKEDGEFEIVRHEIQ